MAQFYVEWLVQADWFGERGSPVPCFDFVAKAPTAEDQCRENVTRSCVGKVDARTTDEVSWRIRREFGQTAKVNHAVPWKSDHEALISWAEKQEGSDRLTGETSSEAGLEDRL